MAEYLSATWLGHILTELLLLTCLIRGGAFKSLPCFAWFITFDVTRAVILFPLWKNRTWTAYGYGFLGTEPVDMVLLACAGIEVFGRLVEERPPRAAYVAIVACVILIGAVLPHHDLQTRTAPTIHELALNKMFMQRALFSFLVIALPLVAACYHERIPDSHGLILIAFCYFDLVAYLSLTLYPAWVKARPFDAPLFVMAGQTACLVAWTIRHITKPSV